MNGANAYIEFSGGRVDVLDFTKDWSVAVSIHTQGQGIEGSNMSTFGTGTVSLNLKVQGAPLYNSNYGQYNTSAHNLYDTATRFNSNSWRAPTNDSRLAWVYTAATRYLQYFISYETGVYQRWGNILVPQTAIDGQTVSQSVCFSKPWDGPGGLLFDGSPYIGTLKDWVLSPHAWSEAELNELFSQSSEALPTLTFYDKISSWLKPGVYPSVVDFKETLTGGQLYNGEPNDFVLV